MSNLKDRNGAEPGSSRGGNGVGVSSFGSKVRDYNIPGMPFRVHQFGSCPFSRSREPCWASTNSTDTSQSLAGEPLPLQLPTISTNSSEYNAGTRARKLSPEGMPYEKQPSREVVWALACGTGSGDSCADNLFVCRRTRRHAGQDKMWREKKKKNKVFPVMRPYCFDLEITRRVVRYDSPSITLTLHDDDDDDDDDNNNDNDDDDDDDRFSNKS
ncbi:hypothetical protein M0804_006374 [Polistes exclamans]|nr:hypothetical protein M0804_006374 [Polistes exclamans]